MSAIVEGSLKAVNYLNNKLPTCISSKLGKFPIFKLSKHSSDFEVPKSFFSEWLDLNSKEFKSALPDFFTWLKDSNETLGHMSISQEKVVFTDRLVVMPEIGMMKKMIIGGAIALSSALIVYFISDQVLQRIFNSRHSSNQPEPNHPDPKQAEGTNKTIPIALGVLAALVVGNTAFSLLSYSPGIYGYSKDIVLTN